MTVFPLKKCKSISKCLVLSWKIGFRDIWIELLLSQNTLIGRSTFSLRSLNNLESHITSHVTDANALYSASIDDLETVGFFLVF